MTPERLISKYVSLWRHSAVVAMADQIVYSGANFIMGLYVGRYASKLDLGLYAFLLLIVLGAADLHRGAIWLPMSMRHEPEIFRPTRILSALYGVILAVAALLCACVMWWAEGKFSPNVMAALLISPVMLMTTLHEINRRILFCINDGRSVLLADIGYAAISVAALILCHMVKYSALYAGLVALSVGAAAGYFFSAIKLRRLPASALKVRDVMRGYLPVARMYAPSNIMIIVSRRIVLMATGSIAGMSALAGVEAARQVIAPLQVVVAGITSFTIPGVSRAWRQNGVSGMGVFISRWYIILILLTLGYGVPACLAAGPFSDVILQKHFDFLAPLAAGYCFLALVNGLNSLLVVQLGMTGYPEGVLISRLSGTLLLLAGIVPLVRWWGVTGAMFGMMCESALSLILAHWLAARRARAASQRPILEQAA